MERQKSSQLPKWLDNNQLDIKSVINVWKGLNTKRTAFLQIVRMQENAL